MSDKAEIKEKDLDNISGGSLAPDTSYIGAEITIGDISGAITSNAKTDEGKESTSYKVGFFPGLSGFP